MATASQIISQAADLIGAPGAWTQGAAARDVNGWRVAPAEAEAVCFCIYGAVMRTVHAGGGASFSEQLKVRDAICDAANCESYIAFNDERGRTQAEVVEVLRKAAKLAEAA